MANLKTVAEAVKQGNEETKRVGNLLAQLIDLNEQEAEDRFAESRGRVLSDKADKNPISKMASGIGTKLESFKTSAIEKIFDAFKTIAALGAVSWLASGGMEKVSKKINQLVETFFVIANGEAWPTEGLLAEYNGLGDMLWQNKELVAGIALLLAPGATISLALTSITLALKGIGAAFTYIAGSGVLGGIVAAIGAVGVAGAGTIIGAALLVANTIHAFYQGIKVFKDTWADTGSFMEALNQMSIEFFAQFLGYPVKLAADAINWVANLLGYEDIIGDFDPVQGIRDFFTDLRVKFVEWDAWMLEKAIDIGTKVKEFGKWIYNSETGEVFGIDFVKLGSDIGATFTNVYAWVKDKVSSIGKFFYDAETGEVFGIDWGQLVADIGATVKESALAIPRKIGDMFTNLWDRITGVFSDFINGVLEKISNVTGINIKTIEAPKIIPAASDVSSFGFQSEDNLMAMPVPGAGKEKEIPIELLGTNQKLERLTSSPERAERINTLIREYKTASDRGQQEELIKAMQLFVNTASERNAAEIGAVVNQVTNNNTLQGAPLSVDIPQFD